MWTIFVSKFDTGLGQLQMGVSDAFAFHPMLVIGCIAGGLALMATTWVTTLDNQLRQLRNETADRGRPIQLRR